MEGNTHTHRVEGRGKERKGTLLYMMTKRVLHQQSVHHTTEHTTTPTTKSIKLKTIDARVKFISSATWTTFKRRSQETGNNVIDPFYHHHATTELDETNIRPPVLHCTYTRHRRHHQRTLLLLLLLLLFI